MFCDSAFFRENLEATLTIKSHSDRVLRAHALRSGDGWQGEELFVLVVNVVVMSSGRQRAWRAYL